MLNWLTDSNGPWSLLALAAGVFAGLITNILWPRLTTILPSLAKDDSLTLDGIWLAKVRYKNVPGRRGLEVFRIKQRSTKFFIYEEHYNSDLKLPVRLRGEGVFRGGMGSAYVFLNFPGAHQSATMTFVQKGTDFGSPVLQGVYSQIIDRPQEREGPIMEEYNLIRIQLPIWQQLKRMLGRTYFENFGDIDSFTSGLPEGMRKYL